MLVSSSFTQAIIRLPRFVATSAAASFQLNLQLRVFEVAGNKTISTTTVPVTLDRTLTPTISAITPRELQPYTAASINVTWALPAASAAAVGLLNATAAGVTSLAAVSFQAPGASRRVSCLNVTVLSSNLSSRQYVETLNCAVGPDMPAASYNAWLCLPSLGCGYFGAAVKINATVTGISAMSGSTAGGTLLVISGSGEFSCKLQLHEHCMCCLQKPQVGHRCRGCNASLSY